METPKGPGRRKAANPYNKRVPMYDTEQGIELVNKIAERRGLSVAALLRTLVREEARRLGIPVDGE